MRISTRIIGEMIILRPCGLNGQPAVARLTRRPCELNGRQDRPDAAIVEEVELEVPPTPYQLPGGEERVSNANIISQN